jgi:hypothetical protein
MSGRLYETYKLFPTISRFTRPCTRIGNIVDIMYLIIISKAISYLHRFPDAKPEFISIPLCKNQSGESFLRPQLVQQRLELQMSTLLSTLNT